MTATSAAETPTTAADAAGRPRVEPPELDDASARDLALVHAHRAGDGAALGELLGRYQDRVFGVCYRMLGDREWASDMAQEAMVRIIQGLDRFDARSRLSTWIIRVTMNVCLTSLRRQKLRRTLPLDAPGPGRRGDSDRGADRLELTGEPGAGQRVESRETLDRLRRALALVSPDQRALLILRDMQDLSYRQIADLFEIPPGTVKSRLFRARAALRERMDEVASADAGDND